jgi:hypothetical protein
VRLGSILINAVVYFVTQSTVNKITGRVSHSTLKKSSAAEVAIVTLTRRSKFYWIVQAISRSGAAIYEFVYGYHGFKGNAPDKQYIGAIFFAVLTPSAAIGYLAIFLLMQPRAYDSLVDLLCVDIPSMFGCAKNSAQDEQPGKGSNKAIKAFAQRGYSVSDSHSIVSGVGTSGHLDEHLLNQSAASSPGSSAHVATAIVDRFPTSAVSNGVPSTVVEANSIADSCESGRGISALSPPTVGTISGTLAGGGGGGNGVGRRSADPGSPAGPGAERISRSVSEASSHTAHSPPPNAQAVQTSHWNTFINHLGSDLVANMAGPRDKTAVGLQKNAFSSGGVGTGSSKGASSVGTLSLSSMRRNFGNNSLQDLNQLEDDDLIDIMGKDSLYSDADDAGVAQLTEFNIHTHAVGGIIGSGEAVGNPVQGISSFSSRRSGTPADDDAPPSI